MMKGESVAFTAMYAGNLELLRRPSWRKDRRFRLESSEDRPGSFEYFSTKKGAA